MDHSSLVEQLDRMRARAVPIIGAGLAVGCGAPSSAELANELAQAAGVEFPENMDLYEVANELERRHGRTWVQECVADITLRRELTPTPVMLAVTLINRRLLATTNYDDAIEEGARRHGLTPKRLVPSHLPTVLQRPGQGELFVLHLHGTAHLPETIVLTDETYEAARRDEALQLAVRLLAAGSSLVFLGHRLASNETHLRRDVKTSCSAAVGTFSSMRRASCRNRRCSNRRLAFGQWAIRTRIVITACLYRFPGVWVYRLCRRHTPTFLTWRRRSRLHMSPCRLLPLPRSRRTSSDRSGATAGSTRERILRP